jgi:hypothetical protein
MRTRVRRRGRGLDARRGARCTDACAAVRIRRVGARAAIGAVAGCARLMRTGGCWSRGLTVRIAASVGVRVGLGTPAIAGVSGRQYPTRCGRQYPGRATGVSGRQYPARCSRQYPTGAVCAGWAGDGVRDERLSRATPPTNTEETNTATKRPRPPPWRCSNRRTTRPVTSSGYATAAPWPDSTTTTPDESPQPSFTHSCTRAAPTQATRSDTTRTQSPTYATARTHCAKRPPRRMRLRPPTVLARPHRGIKNVDGSRRRADCR